MSRPIKNREQFFKHVEEGLQRYFSECDRHWVGILHLTVGVKCGKVGGIIKSDNMLSYEGFTLHRVETILRYALPKYMSRAEVPFAMETILDGLRNYEEEPPAQPEEAPEEQPKRRGRKRKTTQSVVNDNNNENKSNEEESQE